MIALQRNDVIAAVVAATQEDAAIIATTGHTGRALFSHGDRSGNFYVIGSMGCASSIALGVALHSPGVDVYCLDGDGAALMRLEAMVSIGRYRPINLTHVLLDNGSHESTGGQPTLSLGVDFPSIARAVGYASAVSGQGIEQLKAWLAPLRKSPGPHFLHVRTKLELKPPLPRPPGALLERTRRFSEHLRLACVERSREHVQGPARSRPERHSAAGCNLDHVKPRGSEESGSVPPSDPQERAELVHSYWDGV